MKKFIQTLLDLLFPPKCAFCPEFLEREDIPSGLCPLCRKILPRTRENGVQSFDGVTECISPLRYQDEVRQSIHRYKFSGRAGYARPYAKLMAEAMEEYMEGGFDVITWVPLSKKRLRERGYDQGKLLAEALARELGTTALPLLRKDIHTKPQSLMKDTSARRANVAGAYTAVNTEELAGKRVLLVDDVVTTGITLTECAVTLLAAGAAQVRAVTLARGIHRKKTE